MKNPNQNNQSCAFGEQLVEYLYDEIGAGQKAEFERHLSFCAHCADELAAFSETRFAVADWKNEFDRMATPLIEIPFEKPRKTVEIVTQRPGFLESLRGFLTNFPTWATAAGSFAVLAVFAVLAIFLMGSEKGVDMAESNRIKNVTVTPTPANTNQVVDQPKENNQPDKPIQPELAKTNESDKPQVVKTTTVNKPTVKNDTTNKPNSRKTSDPKTRNRNNRNSTPSLTDDDEEEDETLRLADLFDEIDADE